MAYSPTAGVFLMLGVILSGVWRHTLRALKMPKRCALAAHQSALTLSPQEEAGRHRQISLDEHVVPYFTRVTPAPLEKTRVPSRGRSLPAIRLYFSWDVEAERFVGLTVTEADQRLSQVLLDLLPAYP